MQNKMLLYKNKFSRSDYLVATMFLACGGNQLLTQNKFYVFVVVAIMLYLTITKNRRLCSKQLLLYETFFLFLVFGQTVFLTRISPPAYVNFAMKLFAGYLMVSYLGAKFRFIYFRVIVVFAAISFVLWAVHFLIPFNVGLPVGSACRSLGVWAYYVGEKIPRNQGMFWEPGAFQGYLMLIPILFVGELKELWTQERLSCIILLAALLSTTSTTGYVALMFIVGMYFLKGIKNEGTRFFMILLFSVASFFAITTLDFLGNKIQEQFIAAQDITYGSSGIMQSRAGTMYIDLEIIKKHPIVGNGFDIDEKYGLLSDVMSSSGNGLTGFICTFGIPFFLFYLIGLYKRHPARMYYKLVAMSTILLVFYGENFYNYIPYWALLFVCYNTNDFEIYSKRIRA